MSRIVTFSGQTITERVSNIYNLSYIILAHEGPSIEILHTKIIFYKIPSILSIHTNLKKNFFVRPIS